MGWECKNRFWSGTRTYISSFRKNPPPHVYIATLTAHEITAAEKRELVTCVRTWPAVTDQSRPLIEQVVKDIEEAQASD